MKNTFFPTITSLEFLKGLIAATYSKMDGEEIGIEEEKAIEIDAYESPKGGYAVNVSFIDYFVEPAFKGNRDQPADDPEPHRDEQIIYVSAEGDTEGFINDLIAELERVDRAPVPQELDPAFLKVDID